MSNFAKYIKKVMPKVYEESGIQNMNKLAQQFKKAVIYFHEDLDGVTSAIGIKNYLERYNIVVQNAHKIQYGSKEYSIPKSNDDTLNVLVDFANGKYMMHIHTDHHDRQIGAQQTKATSFVKAPSNAKFISTVLSPNEVFPPEDIALISTIDSADYAKQGYTADDVIKSIFNLDKSQSLRINKANQGFVVNKLLLSYKNKPNFLESIVLQSGSSLHSMYITILDLIKKLGLGGKEDTAKGTEKYEKEQSDRQLKLGKYTNYDPKTDTWIPYKPEDILNLGDIKIKVSKNDKAFRPKSDLRGQSLIVGNLLVQYDSSALFSRGGRTMPKYDRYTAFKLNPDVDYFCMIWSMGLIQVSKNPFKKGVNPVSLGELVLGKGQGTARTGGIMDKFKSELENRFVDLETIKKIMEGEIKATAVVQSINDAGYSTQSDAIGFTSDDFANVFKGCRIYGLRKDAGWKKMMRAITDTKYHNLVELDSVDPGQGGGAGQSHAGSLGQSLSKGSYKATKHYKALTVSQIYPEATEVDAGGDPNKILAIDVLKQVKIPLWDIIMVSSGGHKDITNISNLEFYKYAKTNEAQTKDNFLKGFLRRIAYEIANQMKNMKLIETTIEESFKEFIS